MMYMDNIDWRKDMLNTKARLSTLEKRLLMHGPTSFMSAIHLGALKTQWMKMKGTFKPSPEPPNLQSSFKEWNSKFD